jgi:serine/threonine protein kinase
MLTVNQVLQQGRYQIIKPVGHNGIGAGYQAYDSVLGKNVLLKEISISLNKVTPLAQLETLKLTFAAEAKILMEIEHESLLRVYNYFSEIDRHYLVTEYIDGKDLSELLEKNQTSFALADVMSWADQLLDALSYLHALSPPIIHCDIKPQNIKITSDGKIKLLAFGIAGNTDAKTTSTVRNPTFDAANLQYLPLELIWKKLDPASRKVITNSYDEKAQKILEQPADARSDIYSVGATLYHLLTALLPIDALERSIELLEGKADPLPPPSRLRAAIPREVSDVVLRALEIRRESRFSSAVIMRQVLRTSMVRIKEREAEETKKQAAIEAEKATRELQLAEQIELEQERRHIERERLEIEAQQKRLEQERSLIEQKRLELEAEQKRQANLIEQQMQEAEAPKLAEEPAIADDLLLEVEVEGKGTNEAEVQPAEPEEYYLQIPEPEPDAPDVVAYGSGAAQAADSTVEFGEMFAQPEKSGGFMRMAAIAVILMLVGGAAFAVWTFVLSKPEQSNQAVSTNEKGTPTPETTPAAPVESAVKPSAEATPETLPGTISETAPTTSASPEIAKTAVTTAPVVKTKPVEPLVKKPTPSAAKTPPEKKAVTVDDLINDN